MRIEEDMPSLREGERESGAPISKSDGENQGVVSKSKKEIQGENQSENTQRRVQGRRRWAQTFLRRKKKSGKTVSEELQGQDGGRDTGRFPQRECTEKKRFSARDYLDSFGIFIVCATLIESILLVLFPLLFQNRFTGVTFPAAYPPNYVTAIIGGVFPLTFAVSALRYGREDKKKSFRVLFLLHTVVSLLWCVFFFACRLFVLSYLAILSDAVVTVCLLMKFAEKNNFCFYSAFLKAAFVLYYNVINYCIIMLN